MTNKNEFYDTTQSHNNIDDINTFVVLMIDRMEILFSSNISLRGMDEKY